MNMVDSVTDCNKREGLWQLSQRQSVRAFHDVAALHLLIAKLLIHFRYLINQHYSFTCNHIFFHFISFPSRFHSKNRAVPRQAVCLNGSYLAVKLSSVVYNRGAATLSHLHMVRMNPNCSISQARQLLPGTTCHRDILQQYHKKHLWDCASCVLSSMSLN